MMDIKFQPPHFIIVGGSYIGLEFAEIYRRFGSEVTTVEMGPRLIGWEDENIQRAESAGRTKKGLFARSGITAAWDSKFASSLELAEACDVPVRWSCQSLSHLYDWSDRRIDYL
jgi:pyruvate/2-oxoglutarate dehydrogenase complex dihydrolipoamide dehydrogenase (E3) component